MCGSSFNKRGGDVHDPSDTRWPAACRRRCAGVHPIHVQYAHGERGGHRVPDPAPGAGRLRHRPRGRPHPGGRPGHPRHQVPHPYPSGGGHPLRLQAGAAVHRWRRGQNTHQPRQHRLSRPRPRRGRRLPRARHPHPCGCQRRLTGKGHPPQIRRCHRRGPGGERPGPRPPAGGLRLRRCVHLRQVLPRPGEHGGLPPAP